MIAFYYIVIVVMYLYIIIALHSPFLLSNFNNFLTFPRLLCLVSLALQLVHTGNSKKRFVHRLSFNCIQNPFLHRYQSHALYF